jgi:hypothetical protein
VIDTSLVILFGLRQPKQIRKSSERGIYAIDESIHFMLVRWLREDAGPVTILLKL